MIVASDGSGDFKTIQEAIHSIPARNTKKVKIYIKNGIYKEKIRIETPFIRLIGEDPEKTILTYDDNSYKLLPNGERMYTFNSYTIFIGAPDFRAENLTIANSSGSGQVVGQALAAYVDADRVTFKNCRFLGCQDTLFTGPIPDNPVPLNLNLIHPALGYGKEPTGFIRQYYEDCFIQGDVDFIFGSATAVFNRCEISANDQGLPVNGYITAASTHPDNPFGFVFLNCKLTGPAGPNTVYLGRPWRDYAKVAFLNCWMGDQIIAAGWHNWDKPEREKTVTYIEYNSTGPGANEKARVKWAKTLTPEEAGQYTVANILSGPDNWRPDLEE